MTLNLLLRICAAICFMLYALGYPAGNPRRFDTLGLGLFLWIVSTIVTI